MDGGRADVGVRLDEHVPGDAPALPDTPPLVDSHASAPIVRTLDVPTAGCVTETIPEPTHNRCTGGFAGPVGSIVRVRRPAPGAPWYALVRARSETTTALAIGTVDSSCGCELHVSVTGGDLTSHGVGGTFGDPGTVELDVVLDGQDGAVWLRVCDGPR